MKAVVTVFFVVIAATALTFLALGIRNDAAVRPYNLPVREEPNTSSPSSTVPPLKPSSGAPSRALAGAASVLSSEPSEQSTPQTGKVVVTLSDSLDMPVSGLLVTLKSVSPQSVEHPPKRTEITQWSAAGVANFTEVPVGLWRVSLSPLSTVPKDVQVQPDEAVYLSLRLSGSSLQVVVSDTHGVSIAEATVVLADWPTMPTFPIGRTDHNGFFRLSGLPTRFAIGAKAPGYRPSKLIALEGALLQAPLEITLEQGGASLTGLVFRSDGLQCSDARIRVHQVEVDSALKLIGNHLQGAVGMLSTRTDSNGAYTLEGLSPDTYALLVDPEDGVHSPWRGEVSLLTDATVTVNVHLTLGVAVQGIVYYSDGSRASDIAITVRSHSGLETARSATNGTYTVTGNCAGPLKLKASGEGGFYGHSEIYGHAGSTVETDLVLSRSSDIVGRVRCEDSDALHRLMVRAAVSGHAGSNTGWARSTPLDVAGRFAFGDAPPTGNVRLTVLWGGESLSHYDFDLPLSGEIELEVVPPKVGSLSARAIDGAGKPIRTATLTPIRPQIGSGQVHRLESGLESFSVRDLLVGEYVVLIGAPGFHTSRIDALIKPDEILDLGEIVLLRR